MEIKIALTNLGKYNEGELAFKWMNLPYTDEEFQETLEAIGIDGVNYEEYFISDYEAPFHIDEYENLEKLNDMADELENVDFPVRDIGYDVEDVINFANELEMAGIICDSIDYVGDIIEDEHLDDMVYHEVKEYGWRRALYMLNGIECTSGDFYRINGYGNVENIDPDYLDAIMDDLMGEVKAYFA